MNDYIQAMFDGFIKGAKETPRAYFAPLVAFWRLLVFIFQYLYKTTNELMEPREIKKDTSSNSLLKEE